MPCNMYTLYSGKIMLRYCLCFCVLQSFVTDVVSSTAFMEEAARIQQPELLKREGKVEGVNKTNDDYGVDIDDAEDDDDDEISKEVNVFIKDDNDDLDKPVDIFYPDATQLKVYDVENNTTDDDENEAEVKHWNYQDSNFEKKVCNHKCNNNCYDPWKQQCCKKKVIRRPWRCCKHICIKKCFDPNKYKCCKGKLVGKSNACGCSHKCGGKCYDPAKHQCCYGSAISKSLKCCNRGMLVCGNRCYNPNQQKCCRGRPIHKNAPCCLRGWQNCGRRCYNPNQKKCCRGRPIHKNAPCCLRGWQNCGRRCYNANQKKCCRGKPIHKNAPCCLRGWQNCGRRCYNPNQKKCCRGRPIHKKAPCCSHGWPSCGRRCYNPNQQKCCRGGKIIHKRSKCHYNGRRRITKGLYAISLGCYRDHGNRAIPTLEGHDRLLVGNYQRRKYAIEKCALAAARRGWKYFAVQHQGWCASSLSAGRTYNKYGRYHTCRNGKGGPWGNDVYVLQGTPYQRTTGGEVCVFPFIYKGVRYNGCTTRYLGRPWCAVTPNYDVDRLRGDCKRSVYITKGLKAFSLGCYRDHGNRAIQTLERKDRILDGHNYQRRKYAIEKCALAAARRGWQYFAIQHQGWCASSSSAGSTYNKYGGYNTCRNGKGGPWGNDVYVLQGTPHQRTTGGEICVFPFIYKGVRYNGCTTRDHRRPWCAVTPNYDVDRLRGKCLIPRCRPGYRRCGGGCYHLKRQRCCMGRITSWWNPCFSCKSWNSLPWQ